MKLAKTGLILTIIITGSIFYLMHAMTVQPGSISGNGNPALIFIAPLAICFVILVVLWKRVFVVHQMSKRFVKVGMLLTGGYVIIGFVLQRIGLNRYKDVIYKAILEAEGQVDLHYVESITSGLSIHVNNQYFNVNTFFMFISITLLLAFYTYKQDIQVEVRK